MSSLCKAYRAEKEDKLNIRITKIVMPKTFQ